jgi:hypothetical protein
MLTAETRDDAIQLLKSGRAPDDVYAHLVAAGADQAEADALVGELIALKRQADAMDPARLREDAKWMLARGASEDDVVRHFVGAGIAEEHARPEAARIADAVRRMRPCQRCGTLVQPGRMLFDTAGRSICQDCHTRDEIVRSEVRGIASTMESIGLLGGVGGMLIASTVANSVVNNTTAPPPQAQRPFCPHCRVPSGMHISEVDPRMRAQLHAGWSWVCGSCWFGIS